MAALTKTPSADQPVRIGASRPHRNATTAAIGNTTAVPIAAT
ncbi:hypothetical protein [Nocardia vinacea]|nr:hypothetical protein [Nocardia vinacea]